MQNNFSSQKKFSLADRVKSFSHAGRGLLIFVRTTHNAWVQIGVMFPLIFFGFFFSISYSEWMMLVIVFGILFSAEAFNTAIEIDMNLTSPDHHPFARDTKDVAAGAVLIVVFVVIIVSVCIFAPKIMSFLVSAFV